MQAEREREIGGVGGGGDGGELDEKTRSFLIPHLRLKMQRHWMIDGGKENAKRFKEQKRSGTNIKAMSEQLN